MQIITIHGNIVKDAELITFGERQQVKFSVACNRGKNEKKTTTYYDVLSYAVQLQPYLLKGKDVVVVGELSVRKDETNGKTYVHLNVYADSVELCGSKTDTQPAPAPAPQPQPQQSSTIFTGDGLPF